MSQSKRQPSPTSYAVVAPAADREAVYGLIDACRAAVVEYDKSGDHRRHGRGSDCVRCAVAAAVWVDPPPPPGGV